MFLRNIHIAHPLGGATGAGFTPNVPDTETYENISAIASFAADYDQAHELGHEFQLTHKFWASPSNLMCTNILCASHAGSYLNVDQIDTAKKGAKLLAQ